MMIKTLKSAIVLAACLCTNSLSALPVDGGVECTDISTLDYAIYSTDVKARKSRQCELKVNMKNANAITLWQTDLTLPEGFSIATDSWGDPAMGVSGSRTTSTRHNISSNQLQDNTYRLLCASSSNYTFLDKNGEVATIVLDVADNVVDGEYPVVYKNNLLVEANEKGHETEDIVSRIIVKNYKQGDVDGSGKVNVADISIEVDIILGNDEPDNYDGRAYVVNVDRVNVLDINRIVDIILGNVESE